MTKRLFKNPLHTRAGRAICTLRGSHAVLGTRCAPAKAKQGNEELESWLLRPLSPRLHFRFISLPLEERPIVLLEIPAVSGKPTQFAGREWIRVGNNRKPLKDYPELERELWQRFDKVTFESQITADNLSGTEALALLDYPAYFDLLALPLPANRDALLARLEEDPIIAAQSGWNITNLGAILFAKDLQRFRGLVRKTIRIVVYEGDRPDDNPALAGRAQGFTRAALFAHKNWREMDSRDRTHPRLLPARLPVLRTARADDQYQSARTFWHLPGEQHDGDARHQRGHGGQPYQAV